tara:strand:+ start:161 stop:388 length:228 start_codon:yes stop_codon:yes gene_type:complete
MIDAVVAVAIAALSGLGLVSQKLHNRITELDNRLDGVELRIASNYVTKTDLNEMVERVEQHMVRIENKLDKIIIK